MVIKLKKVALYCNNGYLFLWYLPDLNWGHTDFQSVALPTELRYLLNFSGAKIIRFYDIERILYHSFLKIKILYIYIIQYQSYNKFLHPFSIIYFDQIYHSIHQLLGHGQSNIGYFDASGSKKNF